MPRRLMVCLALFSLFLFPGSGRAHFIWLNLSTDDSPRLMVYFGEAAEPGEPRLLAKIAHTQAWTRSAEGSIKALVLQKQAGAEPTSLVADLDSSERVCVEATCDYGIYDRGAAPILLQYYAKHVCGDWTRRDAKLVRAERLALDVAPRLADNRLELEVLYRGQPAAEREVVVVDPKGKSHELKTDGNGHVALVAPESGRYAVRAGYIEPDKSGQREGKAYAQTWHYCTLSFDLPAERAVGSAELSAPEALARARAGRALWKDFPGFAADVTITGAGEEFSAKVTIDADGGVTLDAPKSSLADWAEEQLASLVQHRMPDGEVSDRRVVYADSDLTHPLGRKIDLGDPERHSAYRLKDDVIWEVNRSLGKRRFTISVLEIERNAEHKYLPRSFTMNFFDSASGQLQTSLGYWNEWQRIGNFDLPKTIVEVTAGDGTTAVRRIVFKDCRLSR